VIKDSLTAEAFILYHHVRSNLWTCSNFVKISARLFENEKGSKDLQKTIEADAAATMISGLAGVTSTTAFIESAAGVEEGGRTGLTAVITGILFILPLFFYLF